MRRRVALALVGAPLSVLLAVAPVLACGGLIGPNGAVNLLRTTTFAGYHAGVEHYVTSFEFAGGEGEFGSLTPLPGVPSKVEKGGDWTLQRLIRETDPPPAVADGLFLARTAAGEAQVLMQVRIDALDVTVLKGGAAEVGAWAKSHGFRLPADAPEVLEFYAGRSPIFLAAVFNADAARERGQQVGDGTPVHVTIPTPNPWVPLRILALGKTGGERVEADVYLLTDRAPALLPAPTTTNGLRLDHSARASALLLSDLRSDRGMEWIPSDGWLTKIEVDAAASRLAFDLAIDASGQGTPSRIQAGLEPGLRGAVTWVDDPAGALARTALAALFLVLGIVLVARATAGGPAGPLDPRGPRGPGAPQPAG